MLAVALLCLSMVAAVQGATPATDVRLVIVGDNAVGKTSLLISFTTNAFPAEFIPTQYDPYTTNLMVDGAAVRLTLIDTSGSAGFESMRTEAYEGADIVLVAYAIDRFESFTHATDTWVAEVRRSLPDVPVFLVGLKSDLRGDANAVARTRFVTPDEAHAAAAMVGATGSFEASALTQDGLHVLFHSAAAAGLAHARATAAAVQPPGDPVLPPAAPVATSPGSGIVQPGFGSDDTGTANASGGPADARGSLPVAPFVTRGELARLLLAEYDILALVPAGKTPPPRTTDGTDFAQSPYAKSILIVQTRDLRSLQARDGRFEPDRHVTRGEAMYLAEEILGHHVAINRTRFLGSVSPFSDIDSNSALFNAVMTCVSYGIVSGHADGTIGPLQDVSGAELIAMLDRLRNAIDVAASHR